MWELSAGRGSLAGMDEVRNDVAPARYGLVVGGVTAFAEYELAGDRIVFPHTVVPPALEGRGVGTRLVKAGLADARTRESAAPVATGPRTRPTSGRSAGG